jgi:16S rRNA (cytosine1402-N4)-methyltransferase
MLFHEPALLKEVLKLLKVKQGEKYIDCTLGGGGHAKAILKKGGILLGIDWDKEAIEYSQKRLDQSCPGCNYHLVLGDFSNLEKIAQENKFTQVSGILFDLGVSLHQLKSAKRGFSFLQDVPLDMRMSDGLSIKAVDLINGLNKGELYELFSKLAQENRALAIAKAIVSARRLKKIETTNELVKIIKRIKKEKTKIHPATKVFLALRIIVNDELNNLKKSLPQAVELLIKGGRLVVLSFHSGEDRIVKQFFKKSALEKKLKIMTKKPLKALPFELQRNPASRSVRARVAEKI